MKPLNPISQLPRSVQRVMLSELLDGVTEVPCVYVIESNPLRFVTLQKSGYERAIPGIRDITSVIEGIMGGFIPLKDKGFDFSGEIQRLFAYDVNFFPAS